MKNRNKILMISTFLMCLFFVKDAIASRSYMGLNGAYENISGVNTYGAGLYFGKNWDQYRFIGLEAYVDYRRWYELVDRQTYSVHTGARIKLWFQQLFYIKFGAGAFIGFDKFEGNARDEYDFEYFAGGGLKLRILNKTYITAEFSGRYFNDPIFDDLTDGKWYSIQGLGSLVFHF